HPRAAGQPAGAEHEGHGRHGVPWCQHRARFAPRAAPARCPRPSDATRGGAGGAGRGPPGRRRDSVGCPIPRTTRVHDPVVGGGKGSAMAEHPELAAEQAYVDHAYECLVASREAATRMSTMVEVGRGGTEQARFERDVIWGT